MSLMYSSSSNSILWEGRVVNIIDTRGDGKLEKDNKPNIPNAPGLYVKVRIFGTHTDDRGKLPDDKLPWIEVMGTVLGSGRNSSGATPNIQPGDHVYGIYVNERPIIMGVQLCDPDGDRIPVIQGSDGYAPFSNSILEGAIPSYGVPLKGVNPIESAWNALNDSSNNKAKADPRTYTPLSCPAPNQTVNAAGMASRISKTIQKIEGYERTVREYETTALQYINEKEQVVQNWIKKSSEWMNGQIDKLMKKIQEKVIGKINAASAAAGNLVPLNGRWTVREVTSIAVEILICLFKNIMKAIAGLMEILMKELVNRLINVPLCAIENLLKSLISNILGMLTSALTSIAGLLKGVISNVAGFVSEVLSLVKTILKLFECELNEKDSGVQEWHILDGANIEKAKFFLDPDAIIRDAKGLSDNFKNIVDPDTYDININLIDFSSIFSALGACFTGPIPCGPPTVQFLGGGGQGTTGNAIISAAGEILGVDIITPGFNYTGSPTISFIDACGKGYSATAIPVLGKVPTVILGAVGPVENSSYFLTWSSKNAVRSVTNFGSSELSGQLQVFPEKETTYTISAFDENGLRADDSVTITPGVFVTKGDDLDADNTETFKLADPTDIGVTQVIITNPGFGYTFANDGSTGGDGRTWADPDDTIRKIYDPINKVGPPFSPLPPIDGDDLSDTPDNYSYDQPYPPGTLIPVNPGDIITTPSTSTTTTVIDVKGNDVVTLLPGIPTRIPLDGSGGSTVAPFKDPFKKISITQEKDLPSLGDGQYPVALKICSVSVQSPGLNYSENDIIEVTPSNGAVLKPIIGPFGTIAAVEVINSGMGFSDYPEIKIITETGYNAVLVPYLCVNNVGDLPDDERDALARDGKILQVVDCVGKV